MTSRKGSNEQEKNLSVKEQEQTPITKLYKTSIRHVSMIPRHANTSENHAKE